MNKNNCITKNLAKKFLEAGCKIKSEYWYIDGLLLDKISPEHQLFQREIIPACSYYDIIVTHAKEFFGKDEYYCYECREVILDKDGCQNNCNTDNHEIVSYNFHASYILSLLQQNKRQKAEDYFWANCVFNKK